MNNYKTTIDFWREWDRKTAIRIAIQDFHIHPFDIKYKDFTSRAGSYQYRLQIAFINKEQFSRFIYKIIAHNIDLTDIKIRKGA